MDGTKVFRARARGGPTSMQDLADAPAGEIEASLSDSSLVQIIDETVPNTVPPNTTVGLDVTLRNNAEIISPFDPDVCTAGFFNGYSIRVTFNVDQTPVEEGVACISVSGGQDTFAGEFVSGQAGETHAVEIDVEAADSGNHLHTINRFIDVESDAPEPPDTGEDTQEKNGDGNGEDGGGPLLPCFLDPNRSCETPELIGWAVAVVLVVTAVAGR